MKLERKDETKQSVRGVSSLRVFDYPLTAANVAAIHAQRPLPPPTLLPRGGPMLARPLSRAGSAGGGGASAAASSSAAAASSAVVPPPPRNGGGRGGGAGGGCG